MKIVLVFYSVLLQFYLSSERGRSSAADHSTRRDLHWAGKSRFGAFARFAQPAYDSTDGSADDHAHDYNGRSVVEIGVEIAGQKSWQETRGCATRLET